MTALNQYNDFFEDGEFTLPDNCGIKSELGMMCALLEAGLPESLLAVYPTIGVEGGPAFFCFSFILRNEIHYIISDGLSMFYCAEFGELKNNDDTDVKAQFDSEYRDFYGEDTPLADFYGG